MLKLISSVFVIAFTLQVNAQKTIEGIWITQEQNSKIEIYKKGDNFFGKIVWLEQSIDKKGNPLTDRNNPNKELRNRQILGIDMLQEIQFRDGKWYGKLYTPKKGLTMDAVIEKPSETNLILNVTYQGFTRKQVWTRSSL